MSTVGIAHPGEMGAAIGAALVDAGHTVLWASAGRGQATAARARSARLADVGTLARMAGRADAIISVCPPHAAREVAGAFRNYGGIYVDANAVAPETTRGLAAHFERFVDGGIVGPPPIWDESTRMFLSGPEAAQVATLFSAGRPEAIVVSGEIGAASAVKMAYAAWTKGSAALLLAVRALARAEGVEDALLSEWERSQPDLGDRSQTAAVAALTKGWRWDGEMREMAAALASAGLPEGFGTAAADLYGEVPRSEVRGDPLSQVLGALSHLSVRRHRPPT